MDGQRRTDDSGYVGVHSTDWLEADSFGHDTDVLGLGPRDYSRDLFYPWHYLNETAIMEYWNPQGVPWPAGWNRAPMKDNPESESAHRFGRHSLMYLAEWHTG